MVSLRGMLGAAVLGLAALVSGGVMRPQQAQAWYACERGYTLEVRNNAVRCVGGRGGVETARPICEGIRFPGLPIQITAELRVDANGSNDRCVVLNRDAVADPLCPRGFDLERRRGPDRCVGGAAGLDERPPTVDVRAP